MFSSGLLTASTATTTDLSFFSNPRGRRTATSAPPTMTTTTVRTTVVKRPVPQQLKRSESSGTSASSYPPSSSSPPPASDRSSPPVFEQCSSPKKRKSPSVEVDVVGVSGTDSEAGREPKKKRGPGEKPKGRRKKGAGWSKPFKSLVPPRKGNGELTLEPMYRNSRSRSSSSFLNLEFEDIVPKRIWTADRLHDPAEPLISSASVVRRLMKSYKAHFTCPDDPKNTEYEPSETHPPCVVLEYPNSDATESFILLAPKDKDHYNPVLDLESTVCTLIEFYCTKEQQELFGPNPDEWRSELSVPAASRHARSPPVLPPPLPVTDKVPQTRSGLPIIRAFKKAIRTHDGPMFIDAMECINTLFRSFKYPNLSDDLMQARVENSLMQIPGTWTDTGMPKGVYLRIFEELYQRTVGPNVPVLNKYKSFSNTVYGELLPSLVDEMIRLTNLNENSLFLDLGSGVANVLAQASLQTGCKSFGIELMAEPARVARDVVQQMRARATMWGVRMGDIELEEGDMLQSRRVDELMPQADVVLVDNKVFSVELNEKLKPKFLDLKEGAIVISLAPFVPLNARVTERNVDDITAIFDVTEQKYKSGSVSWGSSGGSYYVHRVDRTGYAQLREKFERTRAQMRSTRSRR